MPILVLAIATLFLFGGIFGVVGATFQTERSYEARIGRLLRSSLIEFVGLFFVGIALALGAKTPMVIPVVIGSLALGSFASLIHHLLLKQAANK